VPIWNGKVYETVEDGKEWWRNADLQELNVSMGISLPKRITWIKNATEIVGSGGSVYDVGCGTGLVLETIPDNCSYYGNDLNEEYINAAKKYYKDRPNTEFAVQDFYEFFDSGRKFDYIILTSIFGFFPENEIYELLPRFWEMCNIGMGITTLNKNLYHARKNVLTSHDPSELEAALWNLPRVRDVEMLVDIPKEQKTIHRGMAAHVWKGFP